MTSYQKILINDLNDVFTTESFNDLINHEIDNIYNKSGASNIIKRYISSKNEYILNDFKSNNIELKIISVNSNYEVFEAISFSAISLTDVIHEKWISEFEYEVSSLRKQLNKIMVLIPIIKSKTNGRYNPINDWKIGRIISWEPSNIDINGIEEEWYKSREIIKNGIKITNEPWGNKFRKRNNLPNQSETSFIHLRPHGINSEDYDNKYFEYTNGKVKICKQSFWLNKNFINRIIKNNKW